MCNIIITGIVSFGIGVLVGFLTGRKKVKITIEMHNEN